MNASVSAQISADNSVFLRGVAAAKDAAKSLQSTLGSLKAPPLPDIGKQLGLQKAQVFKDPFGPEWKAGLQRGTAALKAELDKQAALYRENNRLALPTINRFALSGARPETPGMSHLDGTMFAGMGGPGGAAQNKNHGYALTTAYNVGQDFAQGGPSAIANQVPQIVDLIKNFKELGLAGVALAATFVAAKSAVSLFNSTGDRQLEEAGKNYAIQSAAAQSRAQKREREKLIADGTQAGVDEGARNRNYIAVEEQIAGKQNLAAAQQAQIREAEAELRRLRLASIKEPMELVRAAAAEDKKRITDRIELEKSAAQAALALAAEQQKKVESELSKNRQELDSLPNTALTPQEVARREELTGARAGLNDRAKAARARVGEAESVLGDVKFRETSIVPNEIQQIKIREAQELARIEEQNARDRMEGELAYIRTVREFAELRKQAEANLAAQRKQAEEDALSTMRDRQQGEMEYARTVRQFAEMKKQADQRIEADRKNREQLREQLELSELQSGSPRRAAKKQREMDQAAAVEKYKQAGFSESEAKDMAAREQKVADRKANPRRIRGAGATPTKERESGLGYFDGKHIDAVQTTNLNDVRSVPNAGKTVDHDLAEKDAAAAKKATAASTPAKGGDTGTHALLQKVITSLASISAALGGQPEPSSRTSQPS